MKRTTKSTAKPAAKPAAKSATKPAAAKPAAPKAVKEPAKKAPAKKKAAATTVAAEIDVGFGNSLFIRGEGPGMSWEEGIPMECADSSVWSYSTSAATAPFDFKLLINDLTWSLGENYTAQPGKKNTVSPNFSR